MPIEELISDARIHLSSTNIDRPSAYQSTNTSASALVTTIAATVKSKKNPYAKSEVGKCYRYGEPGNRSNEFRKRKQVTDYKDNGEEDVKIV